MTTAYQNWVNEFTTNDAVIEAVTVGVTIYNVVRGLSQDAIDSGRIVRRWWDERGEDYAWAAIRYTAVTLMVTVLMLAVAAAVTVQALQAIERTWIKYGTLDGIIEPVVESAKPVVTEPLAGMNASDLTAWAFDNFGRYQDVLPTSSDLLRWAEGLRA